MPTPPDVLAYIGLGANLGEPQLTLRQALRELSETPGIWALRSSHIYRSAPVDAEGPDYLNAVAQLHTSLDATALLRRLQAIENAHARQRPYPNAPRTLDLDLLWYGGQVINLPDLQVPHPRMHARAFVLLPLMELAPDFRLEGARLSALLAACGDQRIARAHDKTPTQAAGAPARLRMKADIDPCHSEQDRCHHGAK